MSSKTLRFRPTVQTLETRKLMAGDAFGITGVDDPTVDGNQSTAVISDPGFGITKPGIIAKPAEPVAAVADRPVGNGGGLHIVQEPTEQGGGGVFNNGGTLAVPAGPNGGPHVRVFDGVTGSPLPAGNADSFFDVFFEITLPASDGSTVDGPYPMPLTIDGSTISGNTAASDRINEWLKCGDRAATDQAFAELGADDTSSASTDGHSSWVMVQPMSMPVARGG